jgi:hypothetical protein
MIPGSGCRPKYIPRREPETPIGYGRREEYEGERGPRGRGKSVNLMVSQTGKRSMRSSPVMQK